MTGRHPLAVGFRRNVKIALSERGLPLEVPTIGETMQAAGYATAHFGNWHIGNLRPEHLPGARGFEHTAVSILSGYEDPALLVDGTETPAIPGHLTDIVTNRALEFIASERDRPFFMQL